MKTINAAFAPSSIASIDLSARRAYGRLNTAAIKREERRKSRRALNLQVAQQSYAGVEKDFGMSRMPVPDLPAVQKGLEHLFQLVPAKEPTEFRTVVVTRKRALMRKIVETLRIPVL